MRRPSIIVCGNLTLDELVQTDKVTVTPGGSGLFVSCAAAHLGANVGILGNIGQDYPQSSIDWLETHGVDLRLLRKTRGPSTRFKITQYHGSRRLSLTSPGIPIQSRPVRKRTDGIHLGPVFNEISTPLAQALRRKTGFLSLDLQGFIRRKTRFGRVLTERRNLDSLLKMCDLVQASIDEAQSEVHAKNRGEVIDRLLGSGPTYSIVTLGERGSIMGIRLDKRFLVPAFPDRSIKDTTGAGDVFAGAWLSTYLSTKDPVWAAAVGSAFASLSSRKIGLSKFSFSRPDLFLRAGWVYNHIRALPRT